MSGENKWTWRYSNRSYLIWKLKALTKNIKQSNKYMCNWSLRKWRERENRAEKYLKKKAAIFLNVNILHNQSTIIKNWECFYLTYKFYSNFDNCPTNFGPGSNSWSHTAFSCHVSLVTFNSESTCLSLPFIILTDCPLIWVCLMFLHGWI